MGIRRSRWLWPCIVLGFSAAGCGGASGEEPASAEELDLSPIHAEWKRGEPCGDTARRVADILPGEGSAFPTSLVHLNGGLLFLAPDGIHGRELWRSTGEGRGTALVKDINPGPEGIGFDQPLVRQGGFVFFSAPDEMHGSELWRSDGTAAGTVLVKDLRPGPEGSEPAELTSVHGVLYFTADDGVHGRELWRSDGTPQGTFLLNELVPGPGELLLSELTAWGDVLAFVAFSGSEVSLWKTDGTPGGFQRITTLAGNAIFFDLTPAKDLLYFLSHPDRDTDLFDVDLAVTDGTAGGTKNLGSFRNVFRPFAVGRSVLFGAGPTPDDPTSVLWKSDGTRAGTVIVSDVVFPGSYVLLDGTIYFAGTDTEHGRELWKTDGTRAGTRLVRDIEPGPEAAAPQQLTVIDGTIFFSATTRGHGAEPWLSDGTRRGTRPLQDVAPGALSSSPLSFTHSGWDVFFVADDGSTGFELWALPFRPEGRCRAVTLADPPPRL